MMMNDDNMSYSRYSFDLVFNRIIIYIGDGVTLKTPRPRRWVASARACGQKACLEFNLG